MGTTTALSCDLTNLDRAAREREQALLAWFSGTYTEATWSEAEYRFRVPSDVRTLTQIGELLRLERLCCPFIQFSLDVDGSDDALLRMTGREGVREFIEATFMRQ